jgi:hypothetical protein
MMPFPRLRAPRHRRPPRRLAAGIVLLWMLAAQAATSDLDRLMELLAQRQHGHVTFTEVQHVALLDRPLNSSGELLYDAPDRIEKRTVKPQRESLMLEHGTLTIERGRRKHVLDLHEYPQIVPFIESIRATLAGDRAALERVFRLEFVGNLEYWELQLAPLDQKLAGVVRQIRIAGASADVQTIEVQQADGDRSVMTIGDDVPP